ncbi:MAG: restriction endonuclease subunit S [Bacteroidales bacterium]|nr:restriction endonuclease subunit S [Bacteroidales bacterium]
MAWETKRIKDVVKVNELTLSESTDQNYEFKYIDIGSINLFKIAETETTTFLDAPSRARRIVRKNDVVVSTVRTYLKAITYIDFEPKDMIASTGFAVMTPQKNINPKFLSYAVESDYFIDDVIKNSVGTSYPAINALKLEALSIILPTLEIQRKIAAFLDSKTQNIDRRIELLQKKKERYIILRKAIINEVVNGDEKDWKICRMKDVFSFSKGLSITKADLVETGIPVISYGQIHSKQNKSVEIDDSLIRYVPESYLATEKNALTEQYDFIFADTSEDLEGCGNNVYVDRNETLFAGYHTIILRNRKHQDNKFLAYLFLSDSWRIQIRKSVCGIKVFSITQSDLAPVKIRIPPKAKQKQIVNYLDKKTSAIDSIVEKITKEIDTLKIYRRALVNEAVTGKLDIG